MVESSRSIQERAREHWGAARRGEKQSQMVKHQSLEHKGEQPEFYFKVVSSHRSALNRQIREAVRIRRRGGEGNILNSKAEYNRCHIPRLVVEEEDEDVRNMRESKEAKDDLEIKRMLEDMDSNWIGSKERERELRERKRRIINTEDEGTQKGRKRMRLLRYDIMEDDWGLGEEDKDEQWEQEEDRRDSNNVIVTKTMYHPPPATKDSAITDYFPRMRIQDKYRQEDESWLGDQEDQEDWMMHTLDYVDLSSKEQKDEKLKDSTEDGVVKDDKEDDILAEKEDDWRNSMEEDELYESLTPFLSPTPAPSDTIPGSLELIERDNRGKETPRRVPDILLASPVEGGADVLTLGEPTAPPLVAPPPFWDVVDDDSFEDLGGDVMYPAHWVST